MLAGYLTLSSVTAYRVGGLISYRSSGKCCTAIADKVEMA
jgi:hypothetical protein